MDECKPLLDDRDELIRSQLGAVGDSSGDVAALIVSAPARSSRGGCGVQVQMWVCGGGGCVAARLSPGRGGWVSLRDVRAGSLGLWWLIGLFTGGLGLGLGLGRSGSRGWWGEGDGGRARHCGGGLPKRGRHPGLCARPP